MMKKKKKIKTSAKAASCFESFILKNGTVQSEIVAQRIEEGEGQRLALLYSS